MSVIMILLMRDLRYTRLLGALNPQTLLVLMLLRLVIQALLMEQIASLFQPSEAIIMTMS